MSCSNGKRRARAPYAAAVMVLITLPAAGVSAQTVPEPVAPAPELPPPPAAGTEAVAPAATTPEPDVSATAVQPPPADADLAARVAALESQLATLQEKADEAETAALLAAEPEITDESEPLSIYGFMDFGLDKFFFSEPEDDGFALLRPTPASTFVFGNLNLYFDAKPFEDLRSLVELRFTVAPHGEETALGPPLSTSYERIDTVAFDFSSPSSQAQLRLGGLFIERAWTQYKFNQLFTLQWGMYLNPFGIWNLDHGSPTLISLILPTFIASQMMPTRLVGLNLYGSAFFGASELGYALHVSNGRTPIEFDFDEDKGVGVRLYLANDGDYGRLVLGASGYFGTYEDTEKRLAPNAEGNIFDWVDVVAYREEVVGVDAALDLGDLRLRTEAVFRWVTYDGDKSERIFTGDGSEQYLPNRLEYDAYILAAYRTSIGIEPYVQFEVSDKSYVMPRYAGKSRGTASGSHPVSPSVGFNLQLTPATLFKAQFAWTFVYTRGFEEMSMDIPYVFLRLVNTF